jgi:2-polyprenyl-3-methyl-5-hydroxy-6-metoxy-1,4-benzoquinol methylase
MLFENLKFIFKTYKNLKLLQKTFICIRYVTCPWHKLLVLVNDKTSILDIGCGHGLFLHLIRKRFTDVNCVGFDHDSNKMELANSSTDVINFYSVDQIGEIEKSVFDYVSIIDVLYSVPINDWDKVITMAYEYLKPGGILIIKETVNKPFLKYCFCLMQEIIAIKILRYTKGEFPNLLPIDFYINKLVKNNLVILNHYSIAKHYLWPHYLFIARK